MTQIVLLGDICDIKIGRTPPRKESEWFSSAYGHKWVSIRDMGNAGKNIYQTSEYLTSKAIEKFRIPVIKSGTLMLSFKLTVGRLGFATEDMYSNEAIAQLHVNDPSVVNKNWLYYYLKNFDYNSLSSTSSIAVAVNSQTVKSIKVALPTLDEQKKIADILGAIDEKIELNQQMNKTLEQMGHAFFNHYFVNNPETEVWTRAKISDFAHHLKSGIKPMDAAEKVFSQYSIPAFDNSMTTEKSLGFDIKSGKYQVSDNTILVSKLNPMTPRVWPVLLPEINSVCSTEFQVVKPLKYYSFLYFILTSNKFTEKMTRSAGGTSNSHRRVRPDDIFSYSFASPPSALLDMFEDRTKCLIMHMNANRQEIQTLTTLRDTLLPRLISGKLRV